MDWMEVTTDVGTNQYISKPSTECNSTQLRVSRSTEGSCFQSSGSGTSSDYFPPVTALATFLPILPIRYSACPFSSDHTLFGEPS